MTLLQSSTGTKPERATQKRVIELFRDELGYRFLGDWSDRDGNSNIEDDLLTGSLTRRGYSAAQISAAIYKLRTEASNNSRSLYANNQAVYNLLRYGVGVKVEAGKATETVHLIEWDDPAKNDFAIAEEVTLKGGLVARIKKQVEHYLNAWDTVRLASNENLDLKAYEADMRHLIDTYIEADEPRKISPFDGMSLLELIVKTGIAEAISSQLGGLKGNKEAIAETIENNVRSKIIKEHLNDPAFYEKISALLDEIIASRKAKAIEYEEYLKQIAAIAQRIEAGQAQDAPSSLNTPGKRALYNNLGQDEELALKVDEAVKSSRPDSWRGVQPREQLIKAALYKVLQDFAEVERVFLIVKAQKEY